MWANILNRRSFAMGVGGGLAAGLAPWRLRTAWAEEQALHNAGDIFVAESVPVDITAATVTDARDRGLIQGRVTGLRKVIERLVAREDLARVPTLSSNQVIDMVRDFSIANERSSAVRYIAELTVRFDPAAVRKLLRDAGIPFAETISKPLIVVPVLRTADGKMLLWEENNPWRMAWMRLASSDNGLVPLVAPSGEPRDLTAVNAEQAAAHAAGPLAALANAYNAGGALVAIATPGASSVQVAMAEVRPGLPSEDLSAGAEGGQSFDDLLNAAARNAAAVVEESWRQRNRVTFGAIGQVTALVPITTLKDWLTVRDRLANVSLIERTDLQAMTRDRAQVTLYYAGDQAQLRLALAQRDLSLSQQAGVWVIAITGAHAGTGGQ